MRDDIKLCPSCDTPLARDQQICDCGWSFRADLTGVPFFGKQSDLRDKLQDSAKKDAAWFYELAGEGQREYEPGAGEYWRKRGLALLKTAFDKVRHG